MKPLTDQQRLQLVESEQIYDAWRQAHWRRHDYRYGMRWKKVRNYEYLIRLTDGRGNGRSLGRRDAATEQLYTSFNKGKAAAEDIWRGLSERIELQRRLNRALRLGRMPTIVGDILLALDKTRALKQLRVVGTHALFAYEAMAAIEFKVELLASGDIDLLFDSRKKFSLISKRLDGRGVLSVLQKVDASFEVAGTNQFRAVNKTGFMVDLITQDKGLKSDAPGPFAKGDLSAAAVPNLEWLANAPRIEQVVIAANGQPVMMPVPDPRAFAIHKAWLSERLDREPVKKQRDLNQARMLSDCLKEYLPNFPLDSEAIAAMRYLPLAVIERALSVLRVSH